MSILKRCKLRVFKENYPLVFEAFLSIAQDCGRINRIECPHGLPIFWDVPKKWWGQVAKAETCLLKMSTDERDIFCLGEHNEIQAIRDKYQMPVDTAELFQTFADEWWAEE